VAVRLLLDTNAYSAMRRGDRDLQDLFRRADEILVSTVVLGELLHGFDQGSRSAANREELERFLSQGPVRLVPVTRTTADRYARIATGLRRKGRPIPTNDIWIAAHALETGADLVSYDDHFDAVDGLIWVRPGEG
jgi:tRNA(fMet)-specific endonuclease VapC